MDAGSGAVQRELARLEAAGLVTTSRVGRQKHYQANERAPVFSELRGIVLKTSGLGDVLRDALSPFHGDIRAAFVFGSIAKGSDSVLRSGGSWPWPTNGGTMPSTKASWMWRSGWWRI